MSATQTYHSGPSGRRPVTSEDAPVPSAQPEAGARAPRGVRRSEWQWNVRLGLVTIVLVGLGTAAAGVSYRYHSGQTAETFLRRAEAAVEDERFADQAKWLQRYSLLRPDDLDAVVEMAMAADAAADRAEPSERRGAISNARKQLSSALGRLGSKTPGDEQVQELRGRLIERLLQLQGAWFREAEHQVVALDADPDDPQAAKWLALSLFGQVRATTYIDRRSDRYDKEADYWNWLSNQKVGHVLSLAIDRNPQDLDLIANFLLAYRTQPKLFEGEEKQSEEQASRIDEQIEQTLATLRSNQDSRSKLILYQFERAGESSGEVLERLMEAAHAASGRLDELDLESADQSPQRTSGMNLPSEHWDYLLLQQAAMVNAERDPDQARQWFDQLMTSKLDSVPLSVLENIYLRAGALEVTAGRRDSAIEIWKRGLEETNPESLDLLGALTETLTPIESDPDAAKTVERLRDAVRSASVRLTRLTDSEMPRPARIAFGRKIATASWQLNVFDAIFAVRQGQERTAIKLLDDALKSAAEVDGGARVQVATQLATLYSREGSWDQAAAALDRAVDLAPNDARLRAQAAEAWMRSGNRLKAIEQWRVAASSDSLAIQIASAEALFNYQLRLVPEQRDFSGVRSAVKRIRTKLNAASGGADPAGEDQLAHAVRRLEILELSLPPSGTAAEDHLKSPSMADGVAKLAAKYSDDQSIQLFAAERLAEAGRVTESQQALQQLESIVGPNASSLAIARARIEAATGEPIAASKRLAAQAGVDGDRTDELLQHASDFALRGNDPELAYRFLTQIPEQRRTLTILFSMSKLARSLPTDAAVLVQGSKKRTPLELSMAWEDELRQREGEHGSYWQFLKVTRLIDQLQGDVNRIERNDSRLVEARKLVRDLLTQRPRWGEAIALEGWLSAIENRPEKAVEQLRRGIAAGDRRLQTRQRLWEQLILLNRDAEAEEEIRLATLTGGTVIDKYATARIQLALRQGDYSRSLAVAQAAVEETPKDFLRHVVLGRTATLAAQAAETPEERESFLEQARTAIEKASELASRTEPAIYSARLQLELSHGNKQSILAEISRIEESRLDEVNKSTLMSQGYVALEDYEAALPLLMRADEIQPSTQTQLALAELYRRLRRPDEQVAALRTAQRRSPDSAELRNQLAGAIAARDGSDVNWDELSELLSASDGVTSSNRFLYAVLQGTQGSEQQQAEATSVLRELVAEQNSQSDDAARFLAALLRKRSETLTEEQRSLHDRWLSEVRSIYESLVQRKSPAVVDLYRYAAFLLDEGEDADLPKVETLLTQLRSVKEGTLAALEIGVRYADRTGQRDSAPEVVQSWADDAVRDGILGDARVASIAGLSLLQLGFTDAGLQWFERAYQEEPQTLANYVAALNKFGKIKKGLEVCSQHYEKHADVMSAILLTESMLSDPNASSDPRYQQQIDNAVASFGTNATLLESVGTLRLQQARYDEAIALYKQIQQLDPTRVRTLNNLAMVLAESPGRAAEGIEPINRAIELAGDVPELLDTKGVVLLRAGRLEEAEKVFQQAINESDEPRYRFHLVETFLAQEKQDEAKRAWQALDLEKLDPAGLTPSEQEKLMAMRKTYGS